MSRDLIYIMLVLLTVCVPTETKKRVNNLENKAKVICIKVKMHLYMSHSNQKTHNKYECSVY